MSGQDDPGAEAERWAQELNRLARRLSPSALRRWARALHHSRGPARVENELLSAHPVNGMGPYAAKLARLWRRRPRLNGEALALALLTAATAADHEEERRPRVVASGPFGDAQRSSGPARMTAAVLEEVLDAADRRLLVVGYAHHTSSGARDRLAEAADRGVLVDMVFEETTGALESFSPLAEAAQGRVRLWRWPEHTRGADGKASLHAKVVAADRTLALVGSANLTGRALQHNIEAGVLLRDPVQVRRLVGHFDALMGGGGPLERV